MAYREPRKDEAHDGAELVCAVRGKAGEGQTGPGELTFSFSRAAASCPVSSSWAVVLSHAPSARTVWEQAGSLAPGGRGRREVWEEVLSTLGNICCQKKTSPRHTEGELRVSTGNAKLHSTARPPERDLNARVSEKKQQEREKPEVEPENETIYQLGDPWSCGSGPRTELWSRTTDTAPLPGFRTTDRASLPGCRTSDRAVGQDHGQSLAAEVQDLRQSCGSGPRTEPRCQGAGPPTELWVRTTDRASLPGCRTSDRAVGQDHGQSLAAGVQDPPRLRALGNWKSRTV
ncbi:unnamed protein product [Arctogadus glacialis]